MSPKEVTYQHRAARLKAWLREHPDMNQSDLAKKLVLSRSFISGLLNNTKPFGESIARDIETSLRLPSGYLDAQNEDGLSPIVVWETLDDLPRGQYAMIPRISIRLSAGNGIVAEEEKDVPPLAFTEEWIRSKHVSARKNLRICKVVGDSMSPYLEENDSVMIDTGQKDVIDGRVYCIRWGSELRIKRLFKRFDGSLRVVSDNQNHPEEVVPPMDLETNVAVIGKCIWRAG